jgi:hypothetical protein
MESCSRIPLLGLGRSAGWAATRRRHGGTGGADEGCPVVRPFPVGPERKAPHKRRRAGGTGRASSRRPDCPGVALIWGICVFLWNGDLESAREHIDWLISRSESHSMAPYLAVGRGFKAELAIRQGDAKGGVETLQGCLEKLHSMPYELLSTPLNIALVQGLRRSAGSPKA